MEIRLSCGNCGEIALAPDQVHLEAGAKPAGPTYRFACPGCGASVAKPATPHVLRVLRSHGVATHKPDAPPVPTAPALTPDDLLDFHLALQSADELVGQLQAEAGAGRGLGWFGRPHPAPAPLPAPGQAAR